MSINASKLITLCNFYKTATLEEDMAKRIMLSVIPAMMGKTEKYHSGGFDYKALKSASNGAKDLVKYGTRACVGEMAHYGAGIEAEYNDLRDTRLSNLDEEQFKHFVEIKNKRNSIADVKDNVQRLSKSGQYKEVLKLCTQYFNDVPAWDSSYGGVAWAKISDTLYKLEEKREILQMVREEATGPQPSSKTDYIALEIETMKEIIVLMNVFDGLAHNTGSVMPKVVDEELSEYRKLKKHDNYDHDDEYDVENSEFARKRYQKRIQNLMDVKEIDDPLTAYKEVQDIIEQPQNKHLFGDWVTKIKSSPEYQNAKSLKDKKDELAIIRARKIFNQHLESISKEVDIISSTKDTILNTTDKSSKKMLFKKIYTALNQIKQFIYNIREKIDSIKKAYPKLGNNMYNLAGVIASAGLSEFLAKLINNIDNPQYYGEGEWFDNTDLLISAVAQLKRKLAVIPNAIDQYSR